MSDTITWNDFIKVEMRVGTIVKQKYLMMLIVQYSAKSVANAITGF